ALLLVTHGGVVDRHRLAGGLELGVATLVVTAHHLVLDADVGKGAAHHHLVIAAAGAVLVEVLRLHAALGEVDAGRHALPDATGGRDMVGGDLVAEDREHARGLD